MNSEKLQNLILNAIERKHISQRELAKLTGISRSTLNDLLNGKIKKIKLDDLYQISNSLELDLEDLLQAAGYKMVIKKLGYDRYEGMSNKDLKKLIDEYKDSESDLLNFISDNRKIARETGIKLFNIQHLIERSLNEKEVSYSKEEIIKDINEVIEYIRPIKEKYDYDKLPKDI